MMLSKTKFRFITVILVFLPVFLILSACGQETKQEQPKTKTVRKRSTGPEPYPMPEDLGLQNDFETAEKPENIYSGPEDWRDQIIYFLLVDRFADGDPSNNDPDRNLEDHRTFHGGDLYGIQQNVDYLKELGATAIWITPIVKNVRLNGKNGEWYGYHGYWAQDFSTVDSNFVKTVEDYKSFVDTMHENDILVIQDIVLNHTGNILGYKRGKRAYVSTPSFYEGGYERVFFEDEWGDEEWVEEGQHFKPDTAPFNNVWAYHNYGNIANWDNYPETAIGDFIDLDGIRTENPVVREALITIYQNWISMAGIDGYRIDTVKHMEEDIWDEFSPAVRNHVKSINPDKKFFMFGEAFIGSHAGTAKYVQGQRLDSVLNFQLHYTIKDVFLHGLQTSKLKQELKDRDVLRADPVENGAGASAAELAVNYVDNHDGNRFLSENGATVEKMHNAYMYLFTTVGIPCVYYNTENDTTGDGETGRKDMPDFETEGKPTFDLIRNLSALRTSEISLRRGGLNVLKATDRGAGIFAFARTMPDQPEENTYVFLNTAETEINEVVQISESMLPEETELTLIYSSAEDSAEETATVTGSQVSIALPPYSMKVFKIQ